MYSERFGQALLFAERLHRKQKRKTSGAPYIGHLLGVASLVIDDGGSEDEAIAALLHDSIEDQASYYPGGRAALASDIEKLFGAEALRLVEALTERWTVAEDESRDPRARWRLHKQAYFDQIVRADPSVRRISCADSLHNVRSLTRDYLRMGDGLWSRFRTRSGEDQLWAYGTLASVLTEAGAGPLAEELDRAVDELFRAIGATRP